MERMESEGKGKERRGEENYSKKGRGRKACGRLEFTLHLQRYLLAARHSFFSRSLNPVNLPGELKAQPTKLSSPEAIRDPLDSRHADALAM
ncbi:hypothetical protein EYF80_010548 [Liparis tanakae]|uniref:Uncharacterized protein n=1 Tax=Liparis tanakae TaxID=230148 RepID=A0A4Z2IQ62_9TELE|nr:hypothetical protein EYF80_010548 [Liparis tanakae]